METFNESLDPDNRKRKNSSREAFQLNKSFLSYYESLIEPNEWDDFCESLKLELPVSFRYSAIKSYTDEIKPLTDKYIDGLSGAITKIPWFDNGYEIKMNKKSLKNSVPYGKFRKFLMNATELGLLSRQEAVSMIPPLLLDVKPHHKVLDMCAAPGSKTLQLIELIHANGLAVQDGDHQTIEFPPDGFVIANDDSRPRCFTLIHQTKRIPSPNFIVTSHDASVYPDLLLNKETNERLLFDRILCDVPCSGDGTIRKNIHASNYWKMSMAKGLQKLQCQILKRGIELLNPGGRLIYSTCSMNPVENEAVVLYALKSFAGQINLVDTSDILPNLKCKPGIIPPSLKDSLTPEEISNFNIHYCRRIYPHLQDTGGFFIACFVKDPSAKVRKTIGVSKTKDQLDESEPALQTTTGTSAVKGGIVVSSINVDDPQMESILDFYGIEKLPEGLQAVVRSDKESEKNLIYLTTNIVAQLAENNKEKLRVMTCGVRTIVKSNLKSYVNERSSFRDYRIVQEFISMTNKALYMFRNKITKRIFTIDQKLLYEFLIKEEVEKNDLTVVESHSTEFVTLAENLLNQLNETLNGSIIFKVEITTAATNQTKIVYIAGYHSNKYIRALVKKDVRYHYLLMLGMDVDQAEKILNNKQTKKSSTSAQ